MAWLSGYSKRKEITLTGGASGAQTDFQLKLTISYAAAMQGDFDDLRFTQSDGETLVDAWAEVIVTDTSATVWVEFPTTPANTVEQTYYMYYGNAGVANDWDGAATFPELFDDFEDNDTTDWTKESGASIVCQTDDVYVGTYSGKQTSTGDVQEAYKTFSPINEVIIEWDAMAKHVTDGTYMLIEKTGGDITNSVYLRFQNGNLTYYDGSGHTLQAYNIDQWYKFKVTVHSASDTFDIDIDGVNKGTGIGTRGSIASTVSAFSLFRVTDLNNYVDNIFARKYAANPPTYEFGSEESASVTRMVYQGGFNTYKFNSVQVILEDVTANAMWYYNMLKRRNQ